MRAVIQRVSEASVTVDGRIVGQIGHGMMVLLGVGHEDTSAEAQLLAEKTLNLRMFADADGRFNHSVIETRGAALVVSQFTLYADLRRGRRPGFTTAAPPDQAVPLVDEYCATLRDSGVHVETGIFGAMMQVALVNDGPSTFVLDTALWRKG